MPNNLLLDANNDSVCGGVSDELAAAVVFGEFAASGGGAGLRAEDQSRAVQILYRRGPAAAKPVPRVSVLHLHGAVHRDDLITKLLVYLNL